MTDELKPVAEIVSQSGWFFTAITAAWGIVLRWILGRYQRNWDRVEQKLDDIDNRLSTIEGRFMERGNTGRYRTGHGNNE